ncbi:MAG: hypothetical protein AAF153_02705, partial [Pseudomonadota bacterium]
VAWFYSGFNSNDLLMDTELVKSFPDSIAITVLLNSYRKTSNTELATKIGLRSEEQPSNGRT